MNGTILPLSLRVMALFTMAWLTLSPATAQDGYQYVGQIAAGKLPTPGAITVDQGTGRIFVADSSLHQVFMLASDGLVLKKWGSVNSNEVGNFSIPYGVLAKDGKLWVSENGCSRVQVFDVVSGNVVDSFGVGGTNRIADTKWPFGMSWTPNGDIAMICESFVRRFSPNGIQSAEMGGYGFGNGEFRSPREVTVDTNGRYYATDLEARRVQVFSAAGQWLFSITGGGTIGNQFVPYGVTIRDNKLFVGDSGSSTIKAYALNGTFLFEIKAPTNVNMTVWSIAFDTQGRLLVADPNIKGLRVFAPYWNDSVPPTTVATVSPQAEASGWIRSSATLTLTATDNTGGTGVKDVRYSVDGAAEVVVPGAYAAVAISEGAHTVRYYSTDLGGNVEASATINVKVDSQVPTVATTVENRTVTLAAADVTSGVAQLIVSVDGGPDAAYTVPLVFDTNPHTVRYRAVDRAGNVSATKTVALAGPKLSRILVSPSVLLSGGEATIRVELDAPAGNGGLEVAMGYEYAYLNPLTGFGRRDYTVKVPAGATYYEQRITLDEVQFEAAFSAWAILSDASVAGSATVKPRLFKLVVSPNDIAAGTTALGKLITIGGNGSAYTVDLQSSSPNVLVPSRVTMRAYKELATFPVKVKAGALSEAVTITGTMNEQAARADVNVVAHELAYMDSDNDQVAAGGTVAITVYTTTPAPTGGTKIALSGSLIMPATVVVAAGELSVTFLGKVYLGTSPSAQIVVFATLGKQTILCSVYIVAPQLKSVVFFPSTIVGGTVAKGTVFFSGVLNETKLISLWPDKPAVVNGSFQALQAKDLAAFTLATQAVGSPTVVNVEARGLGTATGKITLMPLGVASVKIAPTTVKGGASAVGTVTLSKVAAVDTTVNLTSGAGVSAPSTVIVKKGFSVATFTVATSATTAKRTVTVSAESDGVKKSGPLTVTP